jgi:type VI secretion system protein ImpA
VSEQNHPPLSRDYLQVMQPVSGSEPCGQSLEYDAEFIMLQNRLQPRLDAEYGSFVEAAEPVNWSEIEQRCQQLLTRSKDIRLIITLMRCRLRQVGLQALPEGLVLLLHCLNTWPEALHPQLQDEGEFDPLMRANAFAELEDVEGFLGDFRQHPLPKVARRQLTLWEFEKAHSALRDTSEIDEATLAAIFQEWQTQHSDVIRHLQQSAELLSQLHQRLKTDLAEYTPDFSTLNNLLTLFTRPSFPGVIAPVEQQQPSHPQPVCEPTTVIAAPQTSPPEIASPANTISHRDDALRQLREIQCWFARHEPSSPVIELLDFTQRIIGMRYTQLQQLLTAELISTIHASQEKEYD